MIQKPSISFRMLLDFVAVRSVRAVPWITDLLAGVASSFSLQWGRSYRYQGCLPKLKSAALVDERRISSRAEHCPLDIGLKMLTFGCVVCNDPYTAICAECRHKVQFWGSDLEAAMDLTTECADQTIIEAISTTRDFSLTLLWTVVFDCSDPWLLFSERFVGIESHPEFSLPSSYAAPPSRRILLIETAHTFLSRWNE